MPLEIKIENKKNRKVPLGLFLLFVVFTFCLIAIGYFYYIQQVDTERKNIYSRLNEIVEFKVSQIQHWRNEKIQIAESLFLNPVITSYLENYLSVQNKINSAALLKVWFKKIHTTYPEFMSVFFVDSVNNVKIFSGSTDTAFLGNKAYRLIDSAKQERKIILSDFHRKTDSEMVHLDLVIPVIDNKVNQSVIGAFLIRINPYISLYSLIQTWPIPSKSAEVLVVRKDGNDVVYLNELRHRKNSVLSFKLPIEKFNLPAVMAIQGREGIVEGIDYRNVEVIAGVKKIPDSPWFLIAKIDSEEVTESLNSIIKSVFISLFALILITALVFILIWRQHRVSFYKQLYRKEIEQKTIAKQYELLTRYANDIILLVDSNQRIIDVNERAIFEYGYSREEFLKLSIMELEKEFKLHIIEGKILKHVLKEGDLFETYHKKKNGMIFPVEISARELEIEGRVFIQEIIRNISERKEAEEALKKSEKLYRDLFEGMLNGFSLHEIILNEDGKPNDYRFLDVNPAFERITGLKSIDIIGKTAREVMPGIEPYWIEIYGKVGLSGEPEYFEQYSKPMKKFFQVSAFSPAKMQCATIFADITERKNNEIELYNSNKRLEEALVQLKETQKQLLQQQRLRALGQMASGIAHDINNSLSPILGYADLLVEEEEMPSQFKKYLSSIRTSSIDIKRTIERMKEFYRKKEDDDGFVPQKLNNIIESAIEFTKHRWKNIPESEGIVIDMKKDLTEDLALIKGNESEIREALTNLVLNASDALPAGGEITIKTYEYDNSVFCEIIDSGIGMNELTRQHCLDPFYSTKGEKGTGLGLSMVYGIMQRHDGEIIIETELGKGASFKLKFPILHVMDLEEKKEEDIYQLPPLKILCIDDEEDVRDLLEVILKKYNHQVILAESGKTGIKLFLERSETNDPFDLVITDLGMPYMDGNSVANVIKKKSPGIPVILLTGWGSFIEKSNLKNIDLILKKPFTSNDLITAIKSVLK